MGFIIALFFLLIPIKFPLSTSRWSISQFCTLSDEHHRVAGHNPKISNVMFFSWFISRTPNTNRNLTIYNIICWFAGTNDSSTKRLMFQVLFFFTISCKILCKNGFNLFSYFFYNSIKIEIKSFECLMSIRNYEKE